MNEMPPPEYQPTDIEREYALLETPQRRAENFVQLLKVINEECRAFSKQNCPDEETITAVTTAFIEKLGPAGRSSGPMLRELSLPPQLQFTYTTKELQDAKKFAVRVRLTYPSLGSTNMNAIPLLSLQNGEEAGEAYQELVQKLKQHNVLFRTME